MIVFLDANIIIYQVEAVEPFQQKVHDVLRELVQHHPEASFAVSRLSMLECLVKPVRERNTAVMNRYREFFTANDLLIVEITAAVVESAIVLRAHHGLRTPDAIHAASALSLKQQVTFLTGDRHFRCTPDLHVKLIE